ncbi:MAG: hypothetical protein MH112_00045 [Phenylobacterium sp.]|uniref:hypothetical protein n=1 Tax=Phenylobacterium sp. TaxID=1871053 RepID=UPI0025DFF3D1|nr:hypothetical protein [Phenylobacterium sp.]MCG9914735.1 hypothetical protein [Phenylobacterium sp.]
MKLLYVKKAYAESYLGGDAIFDRKLGCALERAGHSVSVMDMHPGGRAFAVPTMITQRLPPDAARFATPQAIRKFCEAAQGEAWDGIVISHESLLPIGIVNSFAAPMFFILHNLMSHARGNLGIHSFLRSRWDRIERSAFEKRNVAVGVLSYREQMILPADVRDRSILIQPGLGSIYSTAESRIDTSRVYLSGSSDWGLKRRDLKRFNKLVDSGLVVINGEIPDDGTLRVGIVPDQFQAGFKLKVPDYISRNCAVISLHDLFEDFEPSLAPQDALIKISHPSEIGAKLRLLQARVDAVAADVQRCKAIWTERLTWDACAANVLKGLRVAARAAHDAAG